MFRGRYQHTIDPKGRLSVPARFRDALAQYDGALVVVPNDHCLEVHPLEEWQKRGCHPAIHTSKFVNARTLA